MYSYFCDVFNYTPTSSFSNDPHTMRKVKESEKENTLNWTQKLKALLKMLIYLAKKKMPQRKMRELN
jgi:hypothetical protein